MTPLTSGVPTPAPSLSVDGPGTSSRASSRPIGNKIEVVIPTARGPADSARALRRSIYSTSSKRKRPAEQQGEEDGDDSDDTPDAKLARKLQDEEYAEADMPGPSKRGPGRSLRKTNFSSPVLASQKGKAPARNTRSGASTPASSRAISRRGGQDISDLEDNDNEDDTEDDASFHDDSDTDEVIPIRPKRRRIETTVPPSAIEVDEDSAGVDSDSSLSSIHSSASLNLNGSDGESDDDDDNEDAADAPVPANINAVRRAMANRRAFRAYVNKNKVQKARKHLEDLHPELTTMWDDLKNMPVLKAGMAPQPKTISRQLKSFQREGLAWMAAMEKTEFKGGLLGDEMGLGKTIQAVSLIMSDFPASSPSLVLVPPVALMQWMTEIESYTDGTLKTLVYHGTNAKSKNLTVKDLKKYDVIIMSYNSLESIYRKQEKGFKRKDGLYKEKSIMHQIKFHRVILDEAHSIKTRTTMTAKACFALKVDYRWCLTGTPLQNRIGEFFSLIRFLNIRPFSCYLCRQCNCSSLEWNMDEDGNCKDCKHGGMRHVSVFNQELLNPIQKYGNRGEGADAFRKLRVLTDRIMLRRLKKDHTNAMELPVKEIHVDRQFFGEEETDFASSIMTSGQRQFNTYVASGVMLNNYANIFGLIMQMRQAADHPDLILKKNSAGGQNILVCCICDEPAVEAIRSRCKHDFCRSCAKAYLNSSDDTGKDLDCPSCHIPLSIDLEMPEIEQDETQVKKSSIINRIKMENWTSSSKIELLVHELHRLRSDNASHKSIIFSQFTTMLQLVEWRLRRAGITTVMLDGSMTPAQRQASIEHFMNNVEVECFLVSLKAGGVALNLTEASRVFIVDP